MSNKLDTRLLELLEEFKNHLHEGRMYFPTEEFTLVNFWLWLRDEKTYEPGEEE